MVWTCFPCPYSLAPYFLSLLALKINLRNFFTTLLEGTWLLDFWVHYPTLPYSKLKNHYSLGPAHGIEIEPTWLMWPWQGEDYYWGLHWVSYKGQRSWARFNPIFAMPGFWVHMTRSQINDMFLFQSLVKVSTLLSPVSLVFGCWDRVQGGDPLYAGVGDKWGSGG